ncbi:hypothetical protein PVAND_016485 [Polypedilum vanderplanki]|uniref:Uncharacterized protein n=1 Tax=Polypedilum vanderplanki TaxID=319348 RepID=A0A9J6BGB8_POLVA|nr:hypothetical protein PVAND_016485 [Polypedilum vanderplanki]
MELLLNQTFEDAMLTVSIFYKTQNDNPFQPITQAKDLEICKIIKGAEASPYLKLIVDWLNSILNGYNRLCTAIGQINFNNVTIPKSKFVEAFPEGFFKFIFKYSDNLTVTTSFKLKIDNPYRIIRQTENLEICKLLRNENSVITLVGWLSSILHGYDRLCRLTGQVNFNNITVPFSEFFKIVPDGFFKVELSYKDEIDENILIMKVYALLTR